MKKLDGKGPLVFDKKKIENNNEKANLFIKSFKACLLILNYLIEKEDFEKAEEVIKRQAKILNRFLSVPQRSIIDLIFLNSSTNI